MKKYEKPQIETKEFNIADIIAISNAFEGLVDLDKSKAEDFGSIIARENW